MNDTWKTGKCRRGHDLTDPVNVAIRRKNGREYRICRGCDLDRKRGQLVFGPLPPPVALPDRVCEQCERTYSRPTRPNYHVCPSTWERRKYCSLVCANKAKCGVGRRLPLAEVTRLRALVGLPPVLPEERAS